jgi:hypothetical protein
MFLLVGETLPAQIGVDAGVDEAPDDRWRSVRLTQPQGAR